MAAGKDAELRFLEFFTTNIRNHNTRRAYAQAVREFLAGCEAHRVPSITAVQRAGEAGIEPGDSHSGSPGLCLTRPMPSTFDFCLPTRATTVPRTPDWLYEIKYDGYRLRLERDGDRVRLITKGGYNWTDRYPLIVEAALKNRHRLFVVDGEAVVLGVDGVADFNALRSRRHDHEVQLYAFDIMALDGEDLRKLPLSMRKTNLARLLARRPTGRHLCCAVRTGRDRT